MINLMVALPAEARPIVEHLRLQAVHCDAPHQLYAGGRYRLLVTGIGQVAMAAACGWLACYARDSAWLNVGVAGHRDLDLGSVRVAHRIDDPVLARSWYPPQLVGALAGETVTTVTTVQTDYPKLTLYDMEASAFVAVCSRFSSSELVQSIKVVSDNSQHSVEKINPQMVSELIATNVAAITDYAHALAELADEYFGSAEVDGLEGLCEQIQQRWRFSVTRENQLRSLLRRWFLLSAEDSAFDWDTYSGCRDAAAFLSVLQAQVDALPVTVSS